MTAMLQLNDVFENHLFHGGFPYGKSTSSKNGSPIDRQFPTANSYSDVNIWCPPPTDGHFQAMPPGKHQTSDRKPEKLSLTLPPIGRPCNQRKSTCEIDRSGLHRDEPLSAQSRSNRTDSTTLTPSSRSMSESGYSTVQGEANVKAFGVQTTNSRQSSSTDASCKWDQIGEFRPLAQVARPTTSTLRWQDQIDFASFYPKVDSISPIRNEQAPIQFYNTLMPDQKANTSKSTLRPDISVDRRAYQQSSHDRGLHSVNTANSRMMFTKPDSSQLSIQQHDFVRSFQRLNMNSDYEQRSNNPPAHTLQQGYYSQQAMSLGQSARLTSNDPAQKGSDTFHSHVPNTLNSRLHSGFGQPPNGAYHDGLHVRGAGPNTQNRSHRFFYGGQDDAMYLAQSVNDYYPTGPRLHDNLGSINAGMNPTTALPYELSEQNPGSTLESTHIVRSQMLEDFRMNHKTRKFEFREIRGYIVEFSGDQLGSRFIQHKLETANSDEKDQVFAEIAHDARQLMTDVFGNYVIQKLFEHGSQSQKKVLANQMRGHILALSTQTYGCRVVQKAFEHILTDQQASLVRELDGHILKVVENQNGNHVVQKAIECIPGEYVDFIVQAHRGHVHYLSKHSYGCRVIQRMLEYCQPPAKRLILDELHHDISDLIQDPFGNYVVQHVIVNGEPCDRKPVIDKVQVKLLDNAMHKFASNVVEKAMDYADEEQRNSMLRTLTGRDEDGQSLPTKLLNHQFGNYVIQKAAAYLRGPLLHNVVEEMERYLIQLRRVSTGKQVAALEETIRIAKSRLDPPRQYSSALGVPTQPSRFNIGRR